MGETYQPQSILVTGGCGFIASNLLNYLVPKYPDITFINVDKLDKSASLKNIVVDDLPNYTFIKGDIGSSDLIMHILKSYKIDTIITLAAQSGVDHSDTDPSAHVMDNITSTHNLLDTVRKYGRINRLLYTSTDEIYGDQGDGTPAHEASMIMPNNVYSASKAAAEMLLRAYKVSYKLPIIISRGNNCVGIRQYVDKVFPKFILQLLKGKKLTVHGEGTTRRNFLSVQDTVTALEAILFKGKIGEIYNIGTENEMSVLEVAETLHKRICPEKELSDVIEYVPDRSFNDTRYIITSDKLRSLGWKEETNFDQLVDEMIEWYRKFGDTQWA